MGNRKVACLARPPGGTACQILLCLYLLHLGGSTVIAQRANDDNPADKTKDQQSQPFPRPSLSSGERWDLYIHENFASAGAAFRSAWPALLHTWREDPQEWGKGMGGYGRNLGSQFAKRTIQGSIEHSLAAALKLDPRYPHCQCSGFFPRLNHALFSNFVTPARNGSQTFNLPNVAGIYGGYMISMTWYPDRYSWKDGLREGTQRLLIGGSFNIFREFWPDIKRAIPILKDR